MISFKLFIRNMDERNSIFKNFLTKELDACAFLENPKSDTYLQFIFFGVLEDKNNKLFEKCPITQVSIISNCILLALIFLFYREIIKLLIT